MRWVWLMWERGLSSSNKRSARLPTAIEPLLSLEPRNSAGQMVAARSASAGLSPASTSSSNSLCSENPG